MHLLGELSFNGGELFRSEKVMVMDEKICTVDGYPEFGGERSSIDQMSYPQENGVCWSGLSLKDSFLM